MLKKLLKYEFKATGRLIVIIYLAVFVVSVVTGLLGRMSNVDTQNPIVFSLFVTIYGLLAVALIIITIFMIIERFYKNMLRGEAYLTHTLPVPTWMHVVSKLISAFVWEILAVAVLLCSLFLCFVLAGDAWAYIVGFFNLPEVQEFFRAFSGLVVLAIVATIVQLIRIILMFYASMSIGGSATRHKIFYSFLAFIVIAIVVNVINFITNLGWLTNMMVINFGDIANSTVGDVTAVTWITRILTKQLVTDIVLSAAFFVITHYFLKKRLNLE